MPYPNQDSLNQDSLNQDLETGAFAVTRSEVPVADLTNESPQPKPLEETEMKAKKNNWLKTLAAALALGIASGNADLRAQDEDDDETVYTLSPIYSG